MIIIRIKGGIGNQLFQYSLGRKIALINSTELLIDLDYDRTINDSFYGIHFRLDKFNTKYLNASHDMINYYDLKLREINERVEKKIFINYGIISKSLKYLLTKYDYLIYYKKKIVKEKPKIFDKRIYKIKDNTYLDGYWAKYKYFSDIRDILLKEITLKKEYETEEYRLQREKIIGKNSVSIHVRRGYGKRKIDIEIFGLLDKTYYNNAIALIKTEVDKPYFYIFSDDIKWVKENLKVEEPHEFINYGSDGDYLEIMLMSFCKHNIIANSTFSWWGAWLNENPDKIVIAPKRWYNDESFQKYYEKGYFIPPDWIKI